MWLKMRHYSTHVYKDNYCIIIDESNQCIYNGWMDYRDGFDAILSLYVTRSDKTSLIAQKHTCSLNLVYLLLHMS